MKIDIDKGSTRSLNKHKSNGRPYFCFGPVAYGTNESGFERGKDSEEEDDLLDKADARAKNVLHLRDSIA